MKQPEEFFQGQPVIKTEIKWFVFNANHKCGKYCDMLQFCEKLYGYQCHHATDKIISISWTQNISHNKLLQWPTGTSQIMAKGNVHHDVYNDVYNMTSFMQYTILLKIKM